MESTFPDAGEQDLVEGFARVAKVETGRVWLDPEPGTSCGGCHSAGLCGVGHNAQGKIAARRFAIEGELGLRIGERVVVGIQESSLRKGAFAAYGIPLITLLAGGILGQELGGSDGLAALGAACGLGLGVLVAHGWARAMAARGELTPRFLRRAGEPPADASCH
jgi:sigma-E factor negative regulatory protein RseC